MSIFGLFFSIAYGKVAVDAIGGIAKWFIWNENWVKSVTVRNADDFNKTVCEKTKTNIIYVSDEGMKKCSVLVSSKW